MQTYLLTGIPRSGTTLACKILNDVANTIALHEPLNPGGFKSNSRFDAALEAYKSIKDIEQRLINGEAFEHGNKDALLLDNPISVAQTDDLRKAVAKRGLLSLPPQSKDSALVIKQNAFFASIIEPLKQRFPIVAIVRNPVDVMLSWRSVDLPVNRGHVPAGEKYDAQLRSFLATEPVVAKRQAYIYNWFIRQYTNANVPIVRYEDIITTNGKALTDAFGFTHCESLKLENVKREYAEAEIIALQKVVSENKLMLSSPFYSLTDMQRRLDTLFAQQ